MQRESEDNELRQERVHLEMFDALVLAVDDAHAVLDILLGSSDSTDAVRALREAYEFSEPQAQAVLDLQLRRVTATDVRRIRDRRDDHARRVASMQGQ